MKTRLLLCASRLPEGSCWGKLDGGCPGSGGRRRSVLSGENGGVFFYWGAPVNRRTARSPPGHPAPDSTKPASLSTDNHHQNSNKIQLFFWPGGWVERMQLCATFGTRVSRDVWRTMIWQFGPGPPGIPKNPEIRCPPFCPARALPFSLHPHFNLRLPVRVFRHFPSTVFRTWRSATLAPKGELSAHAFVAKEQAKTVGSRQEPADGKQRNTIGQCDAGLDLDRSTKSLLRVRSRSAAVCRRGRSVARPLGLSNLFLTAHSATTASSNTPS